MTVRDQPSSLNRDEDRNEEDERGGCGHGEVRVFASIRLESGEVNCHLLWQDGIGAEIC